MIVDDDRVASPAMQVDTIRNNIPFYEPKVYQYIQAYNGNPDKAGQQIVSHRTFLVLHGVAGTGSAPIQIESCLDFSF